VGDVGAGPPPADARPATPPAEGVSAHRRSRTTENAVPECAIATDERNREVAARPTTVSA
jgi:hypothetical protein